MGEQGLLLVLACICSISDEMAGLPFDHFPTFPIPRKTISQIPPHSMVLHSL